MSKKKLIICWVILLFIIVGNMLDTVVDRARENSESSVPISKSSQKR